MSSAGRSHTLSLRRLSFVALLALALVGAQIAGVAHRIEHAPTPSEHDGHAHGPSADQDHGGSPSHDCAAYDAATLGDGPPLQIATQTSTRPAHVAIATIVSAVADTSPHLPFHPRAPPRA